jgi:hypothetical protein
MEQFSIGGVVIPQWQSHKKVWASKIINEYERESLGPDDSSITWELECGAKIHVSQKLFARLPEGGEGIFGYYVRYEDGFESWSPKEAFESGYTRI